MTISELIRAARKQAGMTQRELASLSASRQSEISMYERGLVTPTAQTLDRIRNALGVDNDYLPDKESFCLPSLIEPGMKFGRLKVLKKNGKRKDGSIYWLCECKCGNTTSTSSVDLRNGNSKSCGCLRKENQLIAIRSEKTRRKQSEIKKKAWHEASLNIGMIEKTNLSYMKNAKVRSDNKTGVRGVTIQRGKYVATISFNKTKYSLGTFDSLEKAALARRNAEEKLKPQIEELEIKLKKEKNEILRARAISHEFKQKQ